MIDSIKQHYTSICHSCSNARKPASDELTKQGYVGCCIKVINSIKKLDHEEITEAEEVAEGWVDLKSKLKLGKGSGITTNLMLLTKKVKRCNQYNNEV